VETVYDSRNKEWSDLYMQSSSLDAVILSRKYFTDIVHYVLRRNCGSAYESRALYIFGPSTSAGNPFHAWQAKPTSNSLLMVRKTTMDLLFSEVDYWLLTAFSRYGEKTLKSHHKHGEPDGSEYNLIMQAFPGLRSEISVKCGLSSSCPLMHPPPPFDEILWYW